jgi:hypothetical protein
MTRDGIGAMFIQAAPKRHGAYKKASAHHSAKLGSVEKFRVGA